MPKGRIEYESFPLRDDYPRSLLLPCLVATIALGTGIACEGARFGLLAAALLVGMLARYFVPTSYTLDEQGVRMRFLGRERARPWDEMRALYPHEDGVFLSPFDRPRALDPFRGIYVRFARNRDEVLRFCERHLLLSRAQRTIQPEKLAHASPPSYGGHARLSSRRAAAG